jgi:hypothetical protein
MCGAVPTLSHTSSWCGAYLNTRISPFYRQTPTIYAHDWAPKWMTASRPALGPTHPVQWVQGAFYRSLKLTTHLHLVPRLRMRGAVPPLFHTSSWRGV